MTARQADAVLRSLGLRSRTTLRRATGHLPGAVISQSPRAGSTVPPGGTVTLVVAQAPPPAPRIAQPTTPPAPAAPVCDPAYPDACLKDGIGDYDCASGSGDGPNYVNGPIRVLPPDPFDLDRDGDGVGCENG